MATGAECFKHPLQAEARSTVGGVVLVQDLAAMLGATFEGEGNHQVRSVAALEDAGPDDVAFVSSGRASNKAAKQAAHFPRRVPSSPRGFRQHPASDRDPRASSAGGRGPRDRPVAPAPSTEAGYPSDGSFLAMEWSWERALRSDPS